MYPKKMAMIPTKHHFRIVHNNGMEYVYFSIKAMTLSGRYFPIKAATSLRPILFLMNAKILKNISIIAIKNTKDENLLKNMITIMTAIINTIKSIYILLPSYYFLYSFILFFSVTTKSYYVPLFYH